MQKFHEEVTLKVNNLYKSYPLNKGKDKKEVLKGISFEIPKGKILALLGTNGAGKTTTVNILSTLIKADSGQVNLCGFDLEKDPEEIKKHISLTGQFAAVDEELTGRENLIFFAGLNGFTKKEAEQRAEDLIETFRLKDHGDQLVSSYSGGLKRRLDIACSLTILPDLIFLDEPTTGLDPLSRRELWDLIENLTKSNVSILLTTQYLEEAERLADEILILKDGKIALQGSSSYIRENYGGKLLELTFKSEDDLNKALEDILPKVLLLERSQFVKEGLSLSFSVENGLQELNKLSEVFEKSGIKITSASIKPASLEDIFLDITFSKDSREVS